MEIHDLIFLAVGGDCVDEGSMKFIVAQCDAMPNNKGKHRVSHCADAAIYSSRRKKSNTCRCVCVCGGNTCFDSKPKHFLFLFFFLNFEFNLLHCRNLKSPRKLSKENDKERPPFRTVATAAVPKVNKKALMKAKILDATRRALLAQRIGNVATQTEPRTILVRDQCIDAQRDLIKTCDKSFETDGELTIRKENPTGCK